MLSGAAVLAADVIDRTLLPLLFLSFSFCEKTQTNNAGFLV